MADHLRSNRLRPALVLCSSALRTRQTLDGLQRTLGPHADVRIERALYGAGADELLARLRQVDDGIDSVMILGHNPGLQDLAIELAGDGEPAAIAQLEEKFPTCALATLDVGGISGPSSGPVWRTSWMSSSLGASSAEPPVRVHSHAAGARRRG